MREQKGMIMSSILTNTSAMVALQTLRGINKDLARTQSEISTGKSVGSAKDNAAVWSIAKTMESDVRGFKAISDSLSLGSSTVAVARQASETVADLLTQMKGRIVAAQEENVDRDKIQADVEALREQIASVVGAAQFNGLNLVDGSSAASMNILSSLDRNAAGGVTAAEIEVARQNLSVSVDTPMLFGAANLPAGAGTPVSFLAGPAATAEGAGTPTMATVAASTTITVGQVREGVGYEITLGDIQINTADGGTALGQREFQFVAGANDSVDDVVANLSQQMNAFFGVATSAGYTVSVNDNVITINNASGDDIEVGVRITSGGTPGGAGTGDGFVGLLDLNVSTTNGALDALTRIDGFIDQAVSAAAAFGSIQSRIEIQTEFIQNLTDSLTAGIGSLVDADLEATSARLQALQVQQQLATQSLSIANQQPQNILALFR